ncbi:MAG: hypothetical protein NT108_01730 [Candidatus Kaiserbacteria bacterium]|nr:hypothetical protein [Candidatus Kaiserbacteria bacterium]
MSERSPSKPEALEIKHALTDEELKTEVQKNSELSPEEQQANRLANIQKWQHQPTITLTLEEMQALEEKNKREERKGA